MAKGQYDAKWCWESQAGSFDTSTYELLVQEYSFIAYIPYDQPQQYPLPLPGLK